MGYYATIEECAGARRNRVELRATTDDEARTEAEGLLPALQHGRNGVVRVYNENDVWSDSGHVVTLMGGSSNG